MSQNPLTYWPPIINSDSISIWIRVRDIALTIGAWLIIIFTVHNLIWLLVDCFSDPIFELATEKAPRWSEIWFRIDDYIYLALVLIAWVCILAAYRRKSINSTKYILTPSPAKEIIKLEIELGFSHEEIEHWHELRSVNVSVDENSRTFKITSAGVNTA
ncbi:hypothetical protein AOC23_06150 [Polynucleobacter paneuropaeus]|uniref:hypothetical protein n=1 Tax=Polynucleobacter paneuropaeus TaxID=2527775 RepID=UPI001BFE725C|nr:hypothetical protein [Polynucleobacter paneuropaeus]MBT8631651.1 hypothetical protein [Polynucleobacter paneuropaeus]